MRHGWKTRIEERKYFEDKKELREQETALRRIAMLQMNAEINQRLEQMRRSNEIN